MEEKEIFTTLTEISSILFMCRQMEIAECDCSIGIRYIREHATKIMDGIKLNHPETYQYYRELRPDDLEKEFESED